MTEIPSGRLAYQFIADELRARILAGELAAGAPIPSEHELMSAYSVARSTVRQAIEQLRAEGRVATRQGRGSYVLARPAVRRLTTELTTRADRRGWYAAMDREGLSAAVDTRLDHVDADEEVAAWLGVEPGTTVLTRGRVMGAEEAPRLQLATSHIPLDIVERVPALGNVDTGPGGMLSRLEDAGYRLWVEEVNRAALVSPKDAKLLQLPQGAPVLLQRRLTVDRDSGRVLDAMRKVMTDRIEVAYRFGDLPD